MSQRKMSPEESEKIKAMQERMQSNVNDEMIKEIAKREVDKLNAQIEDDRIKNIIRKAGVAAANDLMSVKEQFRNMGTEAAENLMGQRVAEKTHQRLEAARSIAKQINRQINIDAAIEKARDQIDEKVQISNRMAELGERIQQGGVVREGDVERTPATIRKKIRGESSLPPAKRQEFEGDIEQVAVDDDAAQEVMIDRAQAERELSAGIPRANIKKRNDVREARRKALEKVRKEHKQRIIDAKRLAQMEANIEQKFEKDLEEVIRLETKRQERLASEGVGAGATDIAPSPPSPPTVVIKSETFIKDAPIKDEPIKEEPIKDEPIKDVPLPQPTGQDLPPPPPPHPEVVNVVPDVFVPMQELAQDPAPAAVPPDVQVPEVQMEEAVDDVQLLDENLKPMEMEGVEDEGVQEQKTEDATPSTGREGGDISGGGGPDGVGDADVGGETGGDGADGRDDLLSPDESKTLIRESFHWATKDTRYLKRSERGKIGYGTVADVQAVQPFGIGVGLNPVKDSSDRSVFKQVDERFEPFRGHHDIVPQKDPKQEGGKGAGEDIAPVAEKPFAKIDGQIIWLPYYGRTVKFFFTARDFEELATHVVMDGEQLKLKAPDPGVITAMQQTVDNVRKSLRESYDLPQIRIRHESLTTRYAEWLELKQIMKAIAKYQKTTSGMYNQPGLFSGNLREAVTKAIEEAVGMSGKKRQLGRGLEGSRVVRTGPESSDESPDFQPFNPFQVKEREVKRIRTTLPVMI